jgi:hypothetical protein
MLLKQLLYYDGAGVDRFKVVIAAQIACYKTTDMVALWHRVEVTRCTRVVYVPPWAWKSQDLLR